MAASRLNPPLSSGGLLPSATAVPHLQDSIVQDWRDAHTLLAARNWSACPLPDLFGFTVYHYSVYKAFGQEQDAALARGLFSQLTGALALESFANEGAAPLDYACMLAWLHAHFAQEARPSGGQLPIAALDQNLLREGLSLLLEPDAESRRNFFRVLRYFSLRLPDQQAEAYLRQLLVHRPDPGSGAEAGILALGLADGLAGELLVLMKLYQAGIQDPEIKESVREGILRILSVKREVDFLEKKYSIFPDQVNLHTGEATFSAELSWRRGDMGQSLLLYEAHELLQDAELAKIAELVGLNTLLRTSTRSTSVSSAQFDQGAAGVANLYCKLYRVSGQEAYRKGYLAWLGQTQKLLRQELATGFYEHQEGSLLHGLVGVSLVLLSAITEQPLDWDSILL